MSTLHLVNAGKYLVSLTSICLAAVGCQRGCSHFYFDKVSIRSLRPPLACRGGSLIPEPPRFLPPRRSGLSAASPGFLVSAPAPSTRTPGISSWTGASSSGCQRCRSREDKGSQAPSDPGCNCTRGFSRRLGEAGRAWRNGNRVKRSRGGGWEGHGEELEGCKANKQM